MQGGYRGSYEALKAVHGSTTRVQSPLRSADGQVFFTNKAEMDELPSVEEITEAIEQLRIGKASGVDGIPSEI